MMDYEETTPSTRDQLTQTKNPITRLAQTDTYHLLRATTRTYGMQCNIKPSTRTCGTQTSTNCQCDQTKPLERSS